MPRTPLFAVVWLAVLSCAAAGPALAQGEIVFEHSPNGQRFQRLFLEQVQALEEDYYQRLEDPIKRFEQSAQRAVARYQSMMQRSVAGLTRAGDLDAAQVVQTALQKSEAWVLTPPDNQGLHFLSKVDLEVPDNAEATKYGVDLLVGVEKAGETYNKQAGAVFNRYKTEVESARQGYLKSLQDTAELEQREGRLDAVKEVRAAIEAVKNLPEVQPPAAPQPEADEPAGEQDAPVAEQADLPEGAAGVYNVYYRDQNNSIRYRALLLLSPQGSYSLARYYMYERDDSRWDLERAPIKVLEQRGKWMVLSYTLPDGTDLVHEFVAGERTQSDARYWRGKNAYPVRSNALLCTITGAGSALERTYGIEDGVYEMDMQILEDPEGKAIKKDVRLKLLVVGGVVVKTQHNFTDGTKGWQDSEPMAFYAYEREGMIHLYTDKGLAYNKHEAIMDMHAIDGERSVRYWWDYQWLRDGRGPSMVGKFRKLVEEDE